jgi:prophage regulatory protein
MAADLISLRETLARTGLSRRTLFRYREDGKFPAAIRIGERNVLFRADQVDAWLRQNPTAPRVHPEP